MTNEQDDVTIEPATAPKGVGAILKAARQAMGKDLSEVAAQLRIRQPFLAALEDGRHRDLPGGTYAVGFLRSYAEFLSLDAEEMVRRFKLEAAGDLDARAELVFPSPVSEGRVPGGAVIFLGLLMAAIGYGGWYWLSARDATIAEPVPAVPERIAPPAEKPAEPAPTAAETKAEDAQSTAATLVAADDKGGTAGPVADGGGKDVVPPSEGDDDKAPAPPPAPEAAKPQAAAEPAKPQAVVEPAKAEAPKAEAPMADGSESRVVLKAAGADCWLQIREMDGQLLLSRLLRKGDVYAVPDRPGLTMMVGNAGALEIAVDGKVLAPLGQMGQVRRDVKLDPDKLTAGN